jgi:hypothetical protein
MIQSRFCTSVALALLAALLLWPRGHIHAQVPQVIQIQARVADTRSNLDGGQLKFSLADSHGAVTFWSNDGTGNFGQEPNLL